MAGGDMRNARTTGGRLAVSISVLIASGCLGIAGTWSAFSGTTSNAGNTFAAGTVVLSDDDGGAAMFTLPGLDPGETATRCIDVAYTGSLPALVRLRASTTGTGLDSALDLVVTRGSFAMPPGGGSCAGFTADGTDYLGRGAGTIWDGTLGDYPSGWATGLNDPSDLDPESWSAGEHHAYRLTATLRDDDAAQGLTATTTFTWEARNTSGSPAASYGAAVRDSGPVGWWRLDERSGTAGFDSSGGGNDLALSGHYYQAVPGAASGDARRVATRFGGDAFNDGNGDLGDVYDFAGNAPFSVETWIRPETLGNQHQMIFTKAEPDGCCSNRNGYYLWLHNASGVGLERFRDEAKDTCSTGQSPPMNAWSHLAVTYDGATIRIYMDGQLSATCADPRVLRDTSAGVTVGYWRGEQSSHHLHGSLDELAVYDRALTGAEVTAHVQAAG
jgi:hypothetical protein